MSTERTTEILIEKSIEIDTAISPPGPGVPTEFTVLNGDGIPFEVPLVILNGDGTEFTISNIVLNGDGTEFIV